MAVSLYVPCSPHTSLHLAEYALFLPHLVTQLQSAKLLHNPRVAGALFAPVSSCDIALTGLELPPVTVVFCMVDAGKQFALRHRRDAHLIHHVLEAVVRSILRQVGRGGGREEGWLCKGKGSRRDSRLIYHVLEAVVRSILRQVGGRKRGRVDGWI